MVLDCVLNSFSVPHEKSIKLYRNMYPNKPMRLTVVIEMRRKFMKCFRILLMLSCASWMIVQQRYSFVSVWRLVRTITIQRTINVETFLSQFLEPNHNIANLIAFQEIITLICSIFSTNSCCFVFASNNNYTFWFVPFEISTVFVFFK